MIVRARTDINEHLINLVLEGKHPNKSSVLPSVYYFDSGCSSLRFFLSLFGRGKKIGIQVFTCSTVLDAIRAEGDEAVFLDINPKYYTSTLEIVMKAIPSIDILILTHLFGIPNPDYISIKNLCKNNGVVLIDDLCQTFHAKVGGVFLEDLSDNYFYSFFYDKPLSLTNGGMLKLSACGELSNIADERYKNLPVISDRQGHNNLKVLLLMHKLLSPELYKSEFRNGIGWKVVLKHWPLRWNISFLNRLVNGRWMVLLNRLMGFVVRDKKTIKRMSEVEIEYVKELACAYTNNNQTLLDFYKKQGLDLPDYLTDNRISCSISKRAIIGFKVYSRNAQLGLYNWPSLICPKDCYEQYPNASYVIKVSTNLPTWSYTINKLDISLQSL